MNARQRKMMKSRSTFQENGMNIVIAIRLSLDAKALITPKSKNTMKQQQEQISVNNQQQKTYSKGTIPS